MGNSSLLVLALLGGAALQGCSSPKDRRDDHTISATPVTDALHGRASLGMAIPIPGRDACIVPFAVEDRKAWYQDDDPFTRGGLASSYARSSERVRVPSMGGTVRWHNAIVRDFSAGAGRMVLDRRGVISRYSMFGEMIEDPNRPFRADWIVFIATTQDSNRDGSLDDRDATVAIVASADGGTMRVITPERAQVWEVARGDAFGRFYFKVVHDTTGEGRFDDADGATVYAWDPATGSEGAVPVVSPEELGRLESLVR